MKRTATEVLLVFTILGMQMYSTNALAFPKKVEFAFSVLDALSADFRGANAPGDAPSFRGLIHADVSGGILREFRLDKAKAQEVFKVASDAGFTSMRVLAWSQWWSGKWFNDGPPQMESYLWSWGPKRHFMFQPFQVEEDIPRWGKFDLTKPISDDGFPEREYWQVVRDFISLADEYGIKICFVIVDRCSFVELGSTEAFDLLNPFEENKQNIKQFLEDPALYENYADTVIDQLVYETNHEIMFEVANEMDIGHSNTWPRKVDFADYVVNALLAAGVDEGNISLGARIGGLQDDIVDRLENQSIDTRDMYLPIHGLGGQFYPLISRGYRKALVKKDPFDSWFISTDGANNGTDPNDPDQFDPPPYKRQIQDDPPKYVVEDPHGPLIKPAKELLRQIWEDALLSFKGNLIVEYHAKNIDDSEMPNKLSYIMEAYQEAKERQDEISDKLVANWADYGIYSRSTPEALSIKGNWTRIHDDALAGSSGDLDGDCKDDIIASYDGYGVYVRYASTGEWQRLHEQTATLLAAGDVNGDGLDDLIGVWPEIKGIWVRYSDTGSWENIYTGPESAVSIAAGDMDGDGRDDLLGSFSSGVWWRSSETEEWWRIHSDQAEIVAAGDLDGDSRDDLLGSWGETTPGLWVWYSQSDTWDLIHSESPHLIAAKDLDGNGEDDIAAAWAGTGVWIGYKSFADIQWERVVSQGTPDPTWIAGIESARYTITSKQTSSYKWGFVSPYGDIDVGAGKNQTFTIQAAPPDKQYRYFIDEVYINGTPVGPVTSFAFENVRENQSIEVTFRRESL